ncbi:VOC family protein [Deinococcus rubellus]|uniref:VOC family protein n=1 Tax=Deinococcus rubellus TaxID=1889240 RepID=A0ABY5YE48_9DEIO|nr:VOC family protein [Deinococcus rubellus]UWX62986.1 VOC family protein [Deinococcus rubellus]
MTSAPPASLKHVSFLSADADAVSAFYQQLGAQVHKDLTTSEGMRRLVLGFPGGGKLQFFQATGQAPSPHPGWQEHIALYLGDLEASIGQLKASGAAFTRDLTLSPSGNPMAFVLDPDGRQVELLQAGPLSLE